MGSQSSQLPGESQVSTVAAIVTLYSRTESVCRLAEAWRAQERFPDELWLMCEGPIISEVNRHQWGLTTHQHTRDLPTPRDADGHYLVIPYSLKHNYALDRTTCDYIIYGTDDSFPAPDKVEKMAAALDANPDWGAVYCEQSLRSADGTETHYGNMGVVADAWFVLDLSAVMHRRTDDRWSLDMGVIRFADAHFWRALHKSIGSFYPVPFTLDRHERTPDGVTTVF